MLNEIRLVLEQVEGDLGVQAHQDPSFFLVARHAPKRPVEMARHHFRPEYPSRPTASGALGGHGIDQTGAHPLARHLDQPQLRHAVNPRPGPVSGYVSPQLVKELLPVVLVFHVDEVDDDDPADITEPKLPRHLQGGLQVRLENRLIGVLPPSVTPRIHVDRDQGFSLLDDDIAAGWQIDPRVEEMLDLHLHSCLVKQRVGFVAIEVHPLDQIRSHLFQVFLDLAVELLGVHMEAVHVAAEQVTDDPPGEGGLPLYEGRGPALRGLFLDFAPQGE